MQNRDDIFVDKQNHVSGASSDDPWGHPMSSISPILNAVLNTQF